MLLAWKYILLHATLYTNALAFTTWNVARWRVRVSEHRAGGSEGGGATTSKHIHTMRQGRTKEASKCVRWETLPESIAFCFECYMMLEKSPKRNKKNFKQRRASLVVFIVSL